MNHQIEENKSYWNLVWKQFSKRKIAVFSLWIIIFFFFVGVFAHFLANKVPIALYTTYENFYQYRFISWAKSHENFTKALADRKEILKKKKLAQNEFNKLKANLIDINKQKDKLNNNIADLSEKIESIEKKYLLTQDENTKLVKLKNTLNEEAKGKTLESTEAIQLEIDKLEKKKIISEDDKKKIAGYKKERKTFRKELSIVKEKSLKINTQKSHQNIILVQCKNQLNYENTYEIILKSLDKMKFPVKPVIDNKIDKVIDAYDKTLDNHGIHDLEKIDNSLNLNRLVKDLDQIFLQAQENLDEKKIADQFEMKLTFPVIESLSILDIIFISTFLFFLFYPAVPWIIRKILNKTFLVKNLQLYSYIVFVAIMVVAFLLSAKQSVPMNYKKLFYENFISQSGENSLSADIEKALKEKKKDTFIVFPLVPFGYNENNVEEKRQKPSLLKYISEEKTGRHYLGTDLTGRDVLSRMIWGARISLSVGFVAVSIYVTIGIIVGAIAGYFGGLVDMVISRIIEIVICFPSFFLILTIIAFVGPSITNIMIVIGLTSWTGIARLVRGEFLKLRNQDYVTAGKALGLSNTKIIFRHILPNALTPVLVSATFGIASAILTEASLSFLGFGVREPFPSWGQMISMGQKDVINFWWLSLIPGIAIFISVTTYNLVGDALREAIDPRLKE